MSLTNLKSRNILQIPPHLRLKTIKTKNYHQIIISVLPKRTATIIPTTPSQFNNTFIAAKPCKKMICYSILLLAFFLHNLLQSNFLKIHLCQINFFVAIPAKKFPDSPLTSLQNPETTLCFQSEIPISSDNHFYL